jgi:DNA-binding MarR family transcriptional regulator
MDDRTVSGCEKILRLVSQKKLTITQIILQTIPDRSFIVKIIKKMERGQLLKKENDPNHKQRKFASLTPAGWQFVKLIDGAEHYHEALEQLHRKVRENFNIEEMSQNIVRNKLRFRGWTDEEIRSFDSWYRGVRYVITASTKLIIDVLIVKYRYILQNFKLNRIAKGVLMDIMMKQFPRMLQNIEPDHFFPQQDGYDIEERFNPLRDTLKSEGFIAITLQLTENYQLLQCRFIKEQLKDLLSSIFSIIEPGRHHFKVQIRTLKLYIKEARKLGYPFRDESLPSPVYDLAESWKEMILFYQEMMTKST